MKESHKFTTARPQCKMPIILSGHNKILCAFEKCLKRFRTLEGANFMNIPKPTRMTIFTDMPYEQMKTCQKNQ